MAEKIKIAFVHHSLQRGGGSEKVIFDLIRGLDESRFQPLLLCLYDLGELGAELDRLGYRTVSNLVESPADLRGVFRVKKVLEQENCEIVYVTDGFVNMIVGRLAAFLARTPVTVLAFHSYDTVIRKDTAPLKRALLEITDLVFHPSMQRYIALAESHKAYLIKQKRLRPDKISVVYNGVDVANLDQAAEPRLTRQQLGIPVDAQIVSMVASLRRWKDHQMFLNAAVLILEELPDTYFLLAGDGPERPRLEDQVTRLGIASHVIFLGVVKDISSLLAATDVAALTSRHEAFPLSLLEAMAAARPVVATEVGSVSEIVDHGVTGYLVARGNARTFADAVLQILGDPDHGARLGQAGQELVREVFTLEQMVEGTQDLFAEWVIAEAATRNSGKGGLRHVR